MSNSKIITPWLPENLDSLHKHEEELRTKSVLEINADKKPKGSVRYYPRISKYDF